MRETGLESIQAAVPERFSPTTTRLHDDAHPNGTHQAHEDVEDHHMLPSGIGLVLGA